MLTKQDLNAIGNLIDTKLESKLEEKLRPIHKDIKVIKKDLKKLQGDLTSTINYFDKRDDSVKSAIIKTRRELNLSEFEFA